MATAHGDSWCGGRRNFGEKYGEMKGDVLNKASVGHSRKEFVVEFGFFQSLNVSDHVESNMPEKDGCAKFQ